MVRRPTGIVTFLFTDIEGSTKLWEQYPQAMQVALARHDALLQKAIEARDGCVFKTVGDAFYAAFAAAPDAVLAALDAQRTLHAEAWGETPIKVRMALHTGMAEERDGDYFGPSLNRVARLLSAGHGGQILLSQTAQEQVRSQLPAEVELRDLGERRLKDLVRSEHIFQLDAPDLPAKFLPLNTLDTRPNNLPSLLTPFIGREAQLAAVHKELSRPEVRLLTLTGPGGTGKTRLGLQAAAEMLDDFGDGVFHVALAPIGDPALITPTIAQVLGVREALAAPLLERLKDYLRDKHMLLVLDNFEQVVGAALVVSDLLAAAPSLKILVTSRALLRVYGEHEYPVPPLTLPDPKKLPPAEQLVQYEAVQLFVERAQAVQANFAFTDEVAPAVAEICYRLDGLPLAIELAAARVRLLPPRKMLSRLGSWLDLLTGGARDLPARQQTLRSAIDWSYDLLGAEERILLRRLAVFVGGFTLEAAEHVSNLDSQLSMSMLDGLESLVNQSMLKLLDPGEEGVSRFGMLETIHEYVIERLAHSGEAEAVRGKHASYFLALAEKAEPQLHGAEQIAWLDRLEIEHDNMRAALGWALEHGQLELGVRLAGACREFWFHQGHLSEGRRWLARALESSRDTSLPVRAKILCAAAEPRENPERAEILLQESIALYQQIGDKRGVARVLLELGETASVPSHYTLAVELYTQGLTMYRALNDKWGVSKALTSLGNISRLLREYERAKALYDQGLALCRELGDKRGIFDALWGLGFLAREQMDYERAAAIYDEAIALTRELNDRYRTAKLLNSLGEMARFQGNYERAGALYNESLALGRELGIWSFIPTVLHNLGYVAFHQGDLQEAARLFREGLAQGWELKNQTMSSWCLAGLAAAAGGKGDLERAARLFGAANALLQAIGDQLDSVDQAEWDRNTNGVRAQMDETRFASAWASGQAMTAERAIAYALAM